MKSCVDSEKNSDWLKHFAIDFVFDCLHVEKIEELLCVISFVEIESKRQKKSFKKKNKKNVVWDLQSISKKSINFERKLCESDSKSFCEERIVWIDDEQKKNNFFRKKNRETQILDDDIILTNFANTVSLIDHYVRVKDFRNVSFRRIQYYEVFKLIRRSVSKLRSRKEKENSSIVSCEFISSLCTWRSMTTSMQIELWGDDCFYWVIAR
jgi:hypothetical protein